MTGQERFTENNIPLPFDVHDYWRFTYSCLWAQRGKIAEYLVCKALGIEKPINDKAWTLFDILYDAIRIEVKETSLYQEWRGNGNPSPQNAFSIEGAYSEYKNPKSKFCRQSNAYIFCLNKGHFQWDANPLEVNNWDFFVMRTDDICKHCDRGTERSEMAKTLSLSRLTSFVKQGFAKQITFDQIKETIDALFSPDEMRELHLRRIYCGIIEDYHGTLTDEIKDNAAEYVQEFFDKTNNLDVIRQYFGTFNGEDQTMYIINKNEMDGKRPIYPPF